jgi:hypothetical protein
MRDVMARGRFVVRAGEAVIQGTFEGTFERASKVAT